MGAQSFIKLNERHTQVNPATSQNELCDFLFHRSGFGLITHRKYFVTGVRDSRTVLGKERNPSKSLISFLPKSRVQGLSFGGEQEFVFFYIRIPRQKSLDGNIC